MKCIINQEMRDCVLIEDLGVQGGRHVKAVEFQGVEYLVEYIGGRWMKCNPRIEPRSVLTGLRK